MAAALDYVRVLDLSDDRAIYAGKLLGDLGAEVLRLEPPGGDPLRERGPFRDGESLWHAFFAASRRHARAESGVADTDAILMLASCADIVIDCGQLRTAAISNGELLAANSALVIVDVTSFGRDGPWAKYQAPGLVAEALGGVAATSGDADTPPLKLFGDQYAYIAGVYAAIGALAALRHARETGEGQVVELAVHEALASVLEHVLMWAWFSDQLPFGADAAGAFLPRQGSLHWSRAYQVMQAQGGAIMVTPTPDFQKQLAWLAEGGRAGGPARPQVHRAGKHRTADRAQYGGAARVGCGERGRAVFSRGAAAAPSLRLGDAAAGSGGQSAAGGARVVDGVSGRRCDRARPGRALPTGRYAGADRRRTGRA